MIGLLGKKIGMTQIFKEDGGSVPVTVLQVGPCFVVQVRTKEKDGYEAVQLGFEDRKEKGSTRSVRGHFAKSGVTLKRHIKEIRTAKVGNLKAGAKLCVDNFEAGDFVDVSGFSIGKGFQGVMKRWHFAGGPGSHGSMFNRAPGSIGASAYPSRVVKGMKGAGHMGADNVTVQNLKVEEVDLENNLLVIRGAVPGPNGRFVVVKSALKSGKAKDWKLFQEGEPQDKEEKAETSAPEPEASTEKTETAEGKQEAKPQAVAAVKPDTKTEAKVEPEAEKPLPKKDKKPNEESK